MGWLIFYRVLRTKCYTHRKGDLWHESSSQNTPPLRLAGGTEKYPILVKALISNPFRQKHESEQELPNNWRQRWNVVPLPFPIVCPELRSTARQTAIPLLGKFTICQKYFLQVCIKIKNNTTTKLPILQKWQLQRSLHSHFFFFLNQSWHLSKLHSRQFKIKLNWDSLYLF